MIDLPAPSNKSVIDAEKMDWPNNYNLLEEDQNSIWDDNEF